MNDVIEFYSDTKAPKLIASVNSAMVPAHLSTVNIRGADYLVTGSFYALDGADRVPQERTMRAIVVVKRMRR